MIEIQQLVKRFGSKVALDGVTMQVESGSVFGLVGSNGAGKSTLLRTLAGVFRPDGGNILMDGKTPYENSEVKGRTFFVSDYPYFLPKATLQEMSLLYRSTYPHWDNSRYESLCRTFGLDAKGRLQNFSKGMQRQAALILALSTQPDYLLLDEIFDGLDPVVRQLLKKLLAEEVSQRGMTVVIASHNLRELEDVCDHVGIMNRGKVLLERSLEELQGGTVKIQAVFREGADTLPEDLKLLHRSATGRVQTLIVRGSVEQVTERLSVLQPLLLEALPLSLEEIFIYELGGVDYEVKDIVL